MGNLEECQSVEPDLPALDRVAPIKTVQITVRMPNEAEARELVRLALLNSERNGRYGERCEPYFDFYLFRYPIYLPLMQELAENGDERGLRAIQKMYFPEATKALLDLSQSENPEISKFAKSYLQSRNPSNQFSTDRDKQAWTEDLLNRSNQLKIWDKPK